MAEYKKETFWGLNGEKAVVTVDSWCTTITITDNKGEWLVWNQHILDYGVKDGHLWYREVHFTNPVTNKEVIDFKVRPTISWK